MTTKKILFISYDGMTDPLGQSQVIPYLASLTKFGYRFTILSCDKPDRYAAHKAYVTKLIDPFPIQWVSVPYHKSPPVLSSVYDFWQLKKEAVRLHLQENFDMVHTRVGVPTIVALHLKKKYGVHFLNDIRGFWADERIDGGMWNIKNPVYKFLYNFFRQKEDECINIADYNTCLTYAARKEIHTWKQINKQPIEVEVIPCCADLELFNPEKVDATAKQKLKATLQIKDSDIIVSYLGSIGGWYLTDEMMQFCKMLSDRMPQVKFLFISPHLHDVIVAAAAKHHLSADKLLVKHAQRHEVATMLSLSTYSIFFIKPCYSKISSSPTKHGEIMAMGIPVITNAGVGDVKDIVEKYQAGYVVDNFSELSFAAVIDKIVAGKTFDSNAIRNGAKDFYSLDIATERYHKVYKAVLGE
jgi:glycosyltransferase involved in cell wall biosynthesis